MSNVQSPPTSPDAEASVIGSLIIDNDAYADVSEILKPTDFYSQSNRVLYAAIGTIIESGEPAEIVTLTETLRKSGKLASVGGVATIIALADGVTTAAYARTYANIVADKARMRDLIAVGERLAQGGYDDQLTLPELVAKADAELTALSRNVQSGTSDDEALEAALGYLDGTAKLRTGFTELDRATGGFPVGDLTLISARSTTGKSSWMYQIAIEMASESGQPVGILSPDQEKGAIVAVLASRVSGIPLSWIEGRTATPDQRQRFYDGAHYVRDTLLPKLVIKDGPLRPANVEAEVNKLLRAGCCAVFVDTLQAMTFSEARGSDVNVRTQVENVGRTLKALARTYRVPIVAISQIPAATDYQKDKRPTDYDLSEAKNLYNLAQLSLMMYRENIYAVPYETPGVVQHDTVEVRVSKQKTGVKNVTLRLKFRPDLQLFSNPKGTVPGVTLKDVPFVPTGGTKPDVQPVVQVGSARTLRARPEQRMGA